MFLADATTGLGDISLTAPGGITCALGGTLGSDAYTANGDQYAFSFNPYTNCMGTPDPNDASTYSVDFVMVFANSETVNGQSVVFSSDQVELKCTFQSSYTLISELGSVTLQGDTAAGEEFLLSFSLDRTTSDYVTVDASAVIANTMVYHVIYTDLNRLAQTDFTFVPWQIVLSRASDGSTFILFDETFDTCGYSELNFVMNLDTNTMRWGFGYTAFLFDSDQGAEYRITVSIELCNSASSSARCMTAMSVCT